MTQYEVDVAGTWTPLEQLDVPPDGIDVTGIRPLLAPAPTDTCNGYTPGGDHVCDLPDGWGRGFDGDTGANPGRCKYHWDQPYRTASTTMLGDAGYGEAALA